MRILLCSVPFAPLVGGIETVSALLAEQFAAAGHAVCVLTRTPGPPLPHARFALLRRPSPRHLVRAVRAADVVFHNNIGLREAWPLLVAPRPWVIAHHAWLPRSGHGVWAARAKRLTMRAATHIAVSRALAAELPCAATVVPNPYDEDIFRAGLAPAADLDLVFVGRIVAGKGLAVLIEALALLRARGRSPSLTVIGDGPERAATSALARQREVAAQVDYVGVLHGDALARRLARHRLIVVPSTVEESFGLVVLEALACGVVPIVARSGGLPEAAGPCGAVVPRGDPRALADAIERLLDDPDEQARLRAAAPAHLASHTRAAVAARYLAVLERAAGGARCAQDAREVGPA